MDQSGGQLGDDPNFEVLTVAEVRRRYRLEGIKTEPVDFDEGDVPQSLKHLIPLARVWGVGDDVVREDMVAAAEPARLIELKQTVNAVNRDLKKWLGSPAELSRKPISRAYLAFTNLRMVADEV